MDADADDRPRARLDLALERVCRVADLLREQAGLERDDGAARLDDLEHGGDDLGLELVGERFHVVGAAERVDHPRGA